jgi:hypothetical protein
MRNQGLGALAISGAMIVFYRTQVRTFWNLE